MVAVPEEVATPTEVKRTTKILSKDDILLDCGDGFGDGFSDSAVSDKLLPGVRRPSGIPTSDVVAPDSLVSQRSKLNMTHPDTCAAHSHVNDTASTDERKLPRRATTRRTKLSRRSTRRVRQHVLDTNINEFDDDSYVDPSDGEEVVFSETDSECNEDECANGSDESDQEFENELAKQMNISQVHF